MCEVTTIMGLTSLALAAAGTGAQIAGQRQADDERAGVIRRQTAGQQAIRGRAMESAMAALPETAPAQVEANIQSGAENRAPALAAAISPEGGYLPGQSGGPQVVRDAVNRERAGNSLYLGGRADALGRMGGWQDALFGIGQSLRRGAEGVTAAGSASRGLAGLLPGQMAGAGSAGQGLRLTGDLMNVGSQAVGAFGPGAWNSVFGPARPGVPPAVRAAHEMGHRGPI